MIYFEKLDKLRRVCDQKYVITRHVVEVYLRRISLQDYPQRARCVYTRCIRRLFLSQTSLFHLHFDVVDSGIQIFPRSTTFIDPENIHTPRVFTSEDQPHPEMNIIPHIVATGLALASVIGVILKLFTIFRILFSYS